MISLFRKNANSIGSWRIWAEGGTIHIGHVTVLGGSEVRHTEEVDGGKQGRTLDEQVASRIRSRVSRMYDRGYKGTIDEARVSNSNQLGLDRPMLAQPLARISKPDYRGAVQQKKLNGHRCLFTKQDNEVMAYSRQGKPITSIKHILETLGSHVPEGVTIDGELYVHGQRLQTLASWIKREQVNTYDLNFVVYDLMSKDSYVDRHAELSDLCKGLRTQSNGQIMVLPYEPFVSEEKVFRRRDEVIKLGFEGMMVRLDGRGYESGSRSSSLIKIKKFDDAEFDVTDIIPSEDGWGICVCKTIDGKPFKVSAPGNMSEKAEALANKHDYIGKFRLTVEYAELTADGIPFHCSATGWREDV